MRSLKNTLWLALFSISLETTPVSALTLENMLEYYVGSGPDTSLAPNQKLIGDSFEHREGELKARISTQQKAGNLSESDATALRFELNRLKNQFQRYEQSDGGYSHGETNLIVTDFLHLTKRIDDAVSRATKEVSFAKINRNQAQLRNRVESAFVAGELTRAEADSLRFSLRWTDKLKANLIKRSGQTQANYDEVAGALSRVDRRLTRWLTNDFSEANNRPL